MRRFRFYQWNDFHMRNRDVQGRSAGYPGCNEKAAWAAACARGEVEGIEAPNFIASVGDLICGEIDDYDEDYRHFDDHLRQAVDVPLMPCVGNHENRQGEGVEAHNVAYDRCFGTGWHNYVYRVGGMAFIVVDTSGAHRQPDGITAARNAFVARAFEHIGDQPAFVLSHVPLVPMRQVSALEQSFGFSSWKVLDEGLLRVVEDHREQIVAVLCGHIHLTSVVEQNGIFHIMPSGTAGHPADFAAFDVFDDRLEMKMIAAPPELTDDPDRGNIHGARRHGIDYTDDDHLDHDSYLSGNAAERQLTIPLTGARQPFADDSVALRVEHETAPGQWMPVE
jgi:hypothetical protein